MASGPGVNGLTNTYTLEMRDEAFGIWFKNNKPDFTNLRLLLSSIHPNPPSTDTLKRWMEEGYWHERAELIEVKASQKFDESLVQQRTEMMERHAAIAKELQGMGLDFLRKKGIDNVSNAIKVLGLGFEQEQKSRGLGTVSKIFVADDAAIRNRLESLISRLTPDAITGDVRDVDAVSDEETPDA